MSHRPTPEEETATARVEARRHWYVGAKGEQLRECVADALSTIQSDGLRWFDRFAKDREIIRTLERDREAETYGFGAQNSPQRHRLIAYAELSQNNRKAAYQHFNAALEQLRRTAKSSGPHPFEAELLQVIAALKD